MNCSEYSLGFFRPGGVIPWCHEVDQLGVDIVPVIKVILTNSIHTSNNGDKIKPLLYSYVDLTLVSLCLFKPATGFACGTEFMTSKLNCTKSTRTIF